MEGSYHWYFEKGISLTLLPIFGISAFYGSLPVNDYAMGVILPIHIHMGLTSVIVDYLPFRRTPVAHCIALIAQHTATFYSMYGSYIINSRDVGLTEYFKRVWKA
ncbi:hypothetical protein K502DRAFT_294604 [Neoconidiobolus thromboides FSU 785]|nr:hypothetical protein K502DRAFT_294604 [Neoconidiobolus thromboides FSU 785]